MCDMRKVEFVPFRLTETAEIFSIRIDQKEKTELQEFLIAFKNIKQYNLRQDYEQILKTIAGISDHGVKESFFRHEGKMNDRVCAIPLFSSGRKSNGRLRLYCIRISDELLIFGGGGLKTTRTYQENEQLTEYVHTLQKIDKILSRMESEGRDIHREISNLIINID